MSFPAGASTITVTGTLPNPVGGAARSGRVVFTPSARLVDDTQQAIYSGGGSVTLDADGKFSVVLLCTDDPDVKSNGWVWRVDEQPSGGERATYWIELPSTLGTTVDLSKVAEVSAPGGGPVSGGSGGSGTPTGPAGGDLTGTYPNPQLSSATNARFDAAGAATSARTAAAADATAKVAAHTTASDPHGDRAAASTALATHAGATTGVHGIADTSVLETQTGAQSKANAAQTAATTAAATDATSKVTAHTNASDPHGDRAAAASDATGKVAAHVIAVDPHGDRAAAATDAASKVSTHAAAADPHGDRAYADGKLAKSSNLADLGNVNTARSNLGLGGAALLNVGTGAGTVAAGNDSRLTDARTPTAHASTHAAAGADPVTPAAIGALAVSGDQTFTGELSFVDRIPVLPAFDAAFANQAIRKAQLDAAIAGVGGGGGGSTIRSAPVRVTDDNLAGLPAAASWAIIQTSGGTKLQASITATVGDRITVVGRFMRKGSHYLDWVLLDNAGAIALYATTESSSPPGEGDPALYPSLSFGYETGPPMFIVGSGHIDGTGKVTVALAHQGADGGNANVVYAHSTYPWRMRLENIGPEPS